jgi:hypothetical protein
MSPTTSGPRRAAFVALAPLVLVVALVLHPHLPGRQPNIDALAEAVAADPTRWGVVHLATGLGSAALAVVFLTVHRHLQDAGETRWSGRGLPFVIVGSTVYAMLPAMEFAPLAADGSGGDPGAAQHELLGWFVPMLLVAGITFGAGMVCFARSVLRSGISTVGVRRVVAVSLVVVAVCRVVPFSTVQFHVQAIALCAALLPLAHDIWRDPAPTRKPSAGRVPVAARRDGG